MGGYALCVVSNTIRMFHAPFNHAEVQKKTFTKWVNMQLEKGRLQPVESLAKGSSLKVKELVDL